jgi:hypothetical protein
MDSNVHTSYWAWPLTLKQLPEQRYGILLGWLVCTPRRAITVRATISGDGGLVTFNSWYLCGPYGLKLVENGTPNGVTLR